MAELEDDLKAKNWLSILTFDVYKYLKVGGRVVIEQADDGMILKLIGVDANSEGINKNFRRVLADNPEVERC